MTLTTLEFYFIISSLLNVYMPINMIDLVPWTFRRKWTSSYWCCCETAKYIAILSLILESYNKAFFGMFEFYHSMNMHAVIAAKIS